MIQVVSPVGPQQQSVEKTGRSASTKDTSRPDANEGSAGRMCDKPRSNFG